MRPSPLCLMHAAPPPRGWSGNVTFTYDINDGVGNDTATVTLVIPRPGTLQPWTANYTAPYNANFTGPTSVLDELSAANPSAGTLTIVGLASEPPASVGTVTVSSNGSYVFVPATNWFGECGSLGAVHGEGRPPPLEALRRAGC